MRDVLSCNNAPVPLKVIKKLATKRTLGDIVKRSQEHEETLRKIWCTSTGKGGMEEMSFRA